MTELTNGAIPNEIAIPPQVKVITFRLTLEQSVLIGKLGAGEENSEQSFNYIPGSVIRGMLIGAYEKHSALPFTPESKAWPLFFDEQQVAFLNAYPVADVDRRTLPCPRSWLMEKDQGDEELALVHDMASPNARWPDNPKTPKRPFVFIQNADTENGGDDDPHAIFYQPQLSINVHNASTERFIKREQDSTVFRYDALAPGQHFTGAILLHQTGLVEQATIFCKLLMTGGFHIGRSQSAGYGRIQVDQIKPLTTWQEYAPMAIDAQTVVLTLLSDTLLRDSQGRWSTNINTFLQPLGLPAPTATYLAGEIASGFNRKWGLPLPQTPALAAGSVFIFHKLADTERAALLEKLRPFILSGIGERRCEGFGRIGVNVHGLSQLSYRLPSRTRSNGENGAPELTGASATLAQQMVTRLYREMLDRKLLDAIEHPTMKIEPSLENNQLSQLRVVVRQSLSEANPPIVTNFLKNLRSPARKQYHKAKIVGMSLFEWLMAGWQEQQIWRTHFNIDKAQRPHIGNVTATPTAELRYEYTVRLVDALCRKMVRLNQQQAQKQEEQKGVQP